MDNSVIIKGSNSGITVFLDSEMAFEDLLESVSEKFKSASKFFNNANMAISFDGRDLSAEEEKRILKGKIDFENGRMAIRSFWLRIPTPVCALARNDKSFDSQSLLCDIFA